MNYKNPSRPKGMQKLSASKLELVRKSQIPNGLNKVVVDKK